jgi:CRISPR-associated protein Csm2
MKEKNNRNWLADFTEDWIAKSNGINAACITYADDFGKYLKKLSSTQIRNFYGEVKRIQMKGLDKETVAFHLLKPKLAYAAKRDGSDEARNFNKVITKAHSHVEVGKEISKDQFKNFCNFIEAILAYHKSYGGK